MKTEMRTGMKTGMKTGIRTWMRKCPLPLRWAGSVAILGAVLAYQPAISQSTGFTLPYAGDATAVNSAVAAFSNDATTGSGSDGVFASTASMDPSSVGLYATSAGGSGVYGYANGSASATGVYGVGDGASGYGVFGTSVSGIGVYGTTSAGTSGAGVYGANTSGGAAIIGIGNSSVSPTGYFYNNSAYGNAVGLQGQCNAGLGVSGYGRVGVIGTAASSGGYGGYFQGNVQVIGNLSAASKNFKIDHPLDPAHKYLVHSCIESSEQLNLYTGDVTLDSDGRATVQMPDWFEAENTRFHYQLTAIGEAAPALYVAQKMRSNHFEIAGGKAGLEVSWQVTGTRQDAYARAHPLVVEPEKVGAEAGKYLYPLENGRSAEEGIRVQAATAPTFAAHLKTLTMPKPTKPTPRKAKINLPLR